MKLFALLGALALACDDPEAGDLATSLLLHGAAQAHVDCNAQSVTDPSFGTYTFDVSATLMADGSALVKVASGIGSVTAFTPRVAAAPSARFYINSSGRTVTFAGGDATFDAPGNAGYKVIDLSASCSGHNLEAFD